MLLRCRRADSYWTRWAGKWSDVGQVHSGALTACGRQCLDAGVIAPQRLAYWFANAKLRLRCRFQPVTIHRRITGSSSLDLRSCADAETGGKVRDAFFAGRSAWVPFDQIGQEAKDSDPHTAHLDAVLATVNVEKIRQASIESCLTVIMVRLPLVLVEELGCEVVSVGAEPSGQFAHPPEPTAENLEGIAKRVKESGCSVGFCRSDADRLALVDASGRYIGKEYTLALCVQRFGRSGNAVPS